MSGEKGERPATTTVLVASIVGALLGALVPATVGADPATDYLLHCRGCHGPDGSGAPGAVPSFRNHVARFVTVPGGREYLVRVPGTSQSELSDGRVAALLNWMLAEFSPDQIPRDFTPFTGEEVARHRYPPLVRVHQARQALIDAMDPAAP